MCNSMENHANSSHLLKISRVPLTELPPMFLKVPNMCRIGIRKTSQKTKENLSMIGLPRTRKL
jgi:hypothetical protein